MSKPQLSKKANLWPKIERLRREKEYLGVYVSANPLDKYAILLKYICPISVTETTDLSKYIGQELSFGGMVTGYREAYTKKGNRCGFIKIQDYNGEGELALFGEDFTKYRNFGTEGMFIFVNMRVEADWYNNTKARKQIVDIKQLEDVQAKGKYKLDIFLNVGNIDFNFVSTFLSYLKSMEKQNSINSTKSSLNVYLADSVKNVKIQLIPKTEEIQLSTKFLDFLNECEEIDFSLKIS